MRSMKWSLRKFMHAAGSRLARSLIVVAVMAAAGAQAASLNVNIRVGTVLTPGAGTISPTNSFAITNLPQSVTLTAVESNPAYYFDSWALLSTNVVLFPDDGSQTTNDPVITVRVVSTNSGNVTINAMYKSRGVALNIVAIPTNGGYTVPSLGTNWYAVGATTPPITATASNRYEFTGWTGAANTPANPTTVFMDMSKQLEANFVRLWTVSQSKRSGPSAGSPYVISLRDQTTTNLPIPAAIAEQSGARRYRCNGWTGGSGSVTPATQLGANFTSVDLSPITTNTAWTWAWMPQFSVSVITNPSGYISIQELGSDNDPNDLWADSNTYVRVTVTAFDPSKYEPDYVSVNGTRFDLSATYQVDVLVTNAITLSSFFRTSSQDDPGFVAYMTRFGLKAGNVGQRTFDDPDNDGLSNFQEYQLSVTNKSWYYNPINSDTDGDGMDDKYEYESVDSSNLTEAARGSYRPAAVDNGSGSVDNGPEGNPDGDYHWSTTDGYMHLEQPLMNIEEYRGPDNIPPYTNAAVNFGDAAYPFPSNPVGNRPTVYVRVAVATDTGDQSKGNAENSDRDTYDDGFEYSWDQWQHWGRTNVTALIGGTQEVFMIGVTNMVGIYITNTIPNWATARVFNPGHTDVVGNGPDKDVLYDYLTGKVSQYWYDASREYNVWRPDALSPGVAGAPNSIRMDSPPNGEASPRRCSHPFMWDVDQDGLPDGYEVIFGYDPWSPRTIGHVRNDGADNPDDDWMAWAEANNVLSLRNHEVYVSTNYLNVIFPCTNYDPRVAIAEFYPTPATMPGQGTDVVPKNKRYANADEMRGPDGIMCIVPVAPGVNTDDATNPFNVDSDGDGMWDGWENYVALNPSDTTDAVRDIDNDHLNALEEFQSFVTSSTNRTALVPVADWNNKIFPSDPNSGDTDGDQVGDWTEKQYFNGIAATATNMYLDETGTMVTQTVAVSVWSGSCYLSGGLNPTSSDTDEDTLPDPYEASYPARVNATGLDGTIRDAFADADHDKLPNYLEYYTCAIKPWQFATPSDKAPISPDDYFGGDYGTPRAWDWSQQIYIPLYPGQSGVGRFGYSGTCPNLVDSDEDGMDDYYEIYHGICPVYGIVDEWLSRVMKKGRIPVGPPLRPFTGDIRTSVFVSGTPMMDPDGDGLPNSEEAINIHTPFLGPEYHTDPTPMWVTDMAYGGSWVNKYYTPGAVWPWCGGPPDGPPIYAFDFECNEGFDTDNDGYSDREELVVTQTDPLSPERPIKRRALYLPPEKNAYARTFPGFIKPLDQLRSFTVEAWVRPLNPASGANQTVVERPIAVPAGNVMGGDGVRVNFRLGIDPTGLPYIAYNGEGSEGIFYIAKASTASRLSANNWTHLAGTYSVPSPLDPSQRGILTLYVNGQMAAQTNPNELPATARFGNNADPANNLFGAPIIVGASEANPIADMDVTTVVIPSPSPFDFCKGWVDEVRVWSGARTLPEVVTGMKMRMKQVDVVNSLTTDKPMLYHFSFDDLPDPDHTPTAPAGLGFDVTGNYIFPSDYTGVGFWATEASRSQVYAGLGGGDPRYLPWIWNTVGHLPAVPPLDIGDPNAVYNVMDGSNVVDTIVLYPNTTDPYNHYHKTFPSGLTEMTLGFIMYDDLLPLEWAEIDEDVAMWDAGGVPALDPFSSLGDGIPDAWKEQHGFDPFDITVATADPDSDGLNNYYEYLCGTDPKQYISGSDSLSDSEQDSDGDGLSNITELQRTTMPNMKDTDDDGLTDWEEVSGRADPSWVRPATTPLPKVQTDPVNPLSPSVQRSVYLDGNSRLIVPPSDKLMSKNWTVEAWVNPDTNCVGGVVVSRFVQGFTADEYGVNYEVGLTTNSAPAGMLRPYVRFMMMTNGSPRESRVNGLGDGEITNGLHAILIPTGTWTHVAGVCNSTSNMLSLYVNGRLAAYRTDLVALPLTVYGYGTGHRDDEVTIGASRSTGTVSNGFKGYLDNVRIWAGANDADKVLDRYNAPEGVPLGTVSLPLKSGAMTTLGGLSAEVAAVASNASTRLLVKFDDETTAQDSATLTAAGIQVLNYVAPGVRAVKATQQQLVGLGDKVSWTGLLKSSNKISPLLNVGSGSTGSRYVLVTFFGDVAEADAVQAVQAVGGSVYNGKYIASHDVVAQLTDAQLVSLAANNAVSWAAPAGAFLTSGAPVRRMSDELANGVVVAPFVNWGNGWDGPGRGSAKLTYHFILAECNLPQALAKKLVVGALYKWAQYADLTFTETDQIGLPRSIDIAWILMDGPDGTLGLGSAPSDINPEPAAGNFTLDIQETWQDGISGPGTDLNQVALHEEGHCLGMDHSDDPNAIMYPYYNPSIEAVLSPDDIAGIQAIYASAPERFGLAEFRFDDGGATAQDFAVPQDWKNGWTSAARLDGAVFATNTVAPLNKDSDGDGLPDWWEMANGLDAYSGSGINGAYGDPDSDGLNNLGEYLAGTDPHQWSTAGNTFSDYDSRQGPGFRTYGELYDDGDWIPDAWEAMYRGPAPTTNNRGLDPAYYDAALDPDEDGWDNYSEYLAGCNPLDHTNFPMPQISLVMRYSGKLGATLDQALATQSSNTVLRLSFYHKATMDGHPDLTLAARASLISAEGFTGLVGTNLVDWFHLWQGSNYVFAYLDVNGDADWSPTNEPAGIAQSQPINVQWGSVNTIEIGLTDTMPGYPRFWWPPATNVTSYTVSSPLVTRTIMAPRNYFHEGDWLAAGLYGVTTGDVITPWSIYADGVAYTNVLMPSFPRASSLVPATVYTPNGSMEFQYALNELEFTVDTNATAFRLQIAATSNAATPLLSYTNVVPYMDINGVRKIRVPFYAGDNYVPPSGSYASAVWNNGLYWVRVQGFTRGVNSAWSTWSSILVNVQPPSSGGKSMISGDLYYFGKVSHGYGAGQTSNLTMIVQAFQSPGFSGIPDGQVQVSYQCNTNVPSVAKGLYSLKGLRNVPYYVRAFIDLNGNRQLDAWEPFGFVQDIPSNGFYHVAAVDLSGDGNASKSDVRIVIRDRDTDDDGLPDGWEWMYYGMLSVCSSNMGVNGLTLLRNYEIEPADLDPTKTDYDGDGVPDQVEIDWTDAKSGVPANPTHVLAVVNWSNLTTVAGHVYNPYDPVSNPKGTDLNPIKWDTDGDGVSDGYEITHGYDPLNPADGAAQIAKARAAGETIPGIPGVSRVAAVAPGSGQFTLSWQGQVGMNYEVQYSDDLKTWQTASGNPYRYGAVLHTYLDDSPAVNTRFYRVVVK